MTRILVIEDQKDIATAIQTYLCQYKWIIDIIHDGKEGLKILNDTHYDCIVLDIMLPSIDGINLLAQIRKTKDIPVIMTTAKGQLEDKEEAYTYGADDYLVKPFALKELYMRINALLKRSEISDIYSYNGIDIDTNEKTVYKDGKKISLTLKEWQILLYLVDHSHSAVSRADIISDVWGEEAMRDRYDKLDVYIAKLRKKLRKDVIHTIKGFGYKIASKH